MISIADCHGEKLFKRNTSSLWIELFSKFTDLFSTSLLINRTYFNLIFKFEFNNISDVYHLIQKQTWLSVVRMKGAFILNLFTKYWQWLWKNLGEYLTFSRWTKKRFVSRLTKRICGQIYTPTAEHVFTSNGCYSMYSWNLLYIVFIH